MKYLLRPSLAALSGFLVLLVWCHPAVAQTTPGISDKEVTIGSCSALEGPSQFLGTQTVAGARAYFESINEQGGVHGRKLRLVSYDDSYDPAKAEECFNRLQKQGVFALGFFVGTPTALKYVPLAETNKIPLVGLFTGAQALYTPFRHWVINVRAGYADETKEQIDGMWKTLGYKKIGVIYPDDAFGAAVLDGVKTALKDHQSQPVAMGSYPRQTSQADAAIQTVRAAQPEAVVIVGPANTVAPIIKLAHSKGWSPLFVTVSFVGTDDLIKLAGSDAEGMVITQVVPPYYLTDLKTVALYRRTMSKYAPNDPPNFVSLEGFVDAMVMVEGLKRAGKDLTRDGLIRGIESMHDFEMGLGPQLKLEYSPHDHKGFDHVIPTVVRGGRAVPFTDWSTAAPH
ncbi:MAG TPA: ABC transporter substrate-binding protein [Candidatus Dormibacteraeota bacterium]|jgi:branched-chain amino acid transport system substrate-binding protein|nr:ABC transporter substrate-binding protein [Candidatus Dormibacteraeota bacterium]